MRLKDFADTNYEMQETYMFMILIAAITAIIIIIIINWSWKFIQLKPPGFGEYNVGQET